MLFKSSASPKENPGSKRLRRALGLLLGSALAVQYKQDRIFRASVNLQLVMVSGQSVSALPGHLIYLSALYTFVMMFLAISNLIRFRKLGSPILSAAKVLSLVAALLSLLTLQSALIDRFGTAQGSFRLMMTRLTGSAVYAAVLIIAVWMLRRPLTISANGIEEELTAP